MTCAGFWALLEAIPGAIAAVRGLVGSFYAYRRGKRAEARAERNAARAKLTEELKKPEITDEDRARIARELAGLSAGRK